MKAEGAIPHLLLAAAVGLGEREGVEIWFFCQALLLLPRCGFFCILERESHLSPWAGRGTLVIMANMH